MVKRNSTDLYIGDAENAISNSDILIASMATPIGCVRLLVKMNYKAWSSDDTVDPKFSVVYKDSTLTDMLEVFEGERLEPAVECYNQFAAKLTK